MPCLTYPLHALGMSLESAGVTCMPQVGLVGPASVTFPVVASGEPVSVPDNLLKICKAKPVIFKGKYSNAPGAEGRGAQGYRQHDTSSQSDSTPSCPPGKTSKAVSRAMREPSRKVTGVAPDQTPQVQSPSLFSVGQPCSVTTICLFICSNPFIWAPL